MLPHYITQVNVVFFALFEIPLVAEITFAAMKPHTVSSLHGIHGKKGDGDDFDASNTTFPFLPG